MSGTLRERFMRWLCRNFGHRPRIHYDFRGGGDPEICDRCHCLLSTSWSRARASKGGAA